MSENETSKRPEEELESLLAEVRTCEQGAGGPEAALALLEAAPPRLRRYGGFAFAQGTLRFRTNDVAAAIEAFERAVGFSPDVAEYHSNLGAALLRRFRQRAEPGDLARAVTVLEDAASQRPKFASVHANHGLALQLAGRHEEAIAAQDRALTLDPNDVAALFNLASALAALDRRVQALATLDRLEEIAPDLPELRRARASLLSKRG